MLLFSFKKNCLKNENSGQNVPGNQKPLINTLLSDTFNIKEHSKTHYSINAQE